MKAYISIDIEGLPGIASITMVSPRSSQYSWGSRIMTTIACETAKMLLENGFDKIVLADSHGYMTNIDYLEMPRNTTLIQGFPRPYSMLTGVDSSYDAVIFLGYHSGAGTVHGFLDHTMSSRVFQEIFVNNIRMSEYLLNSLYVGEKELPVILVAGDTYLREEVQKHTPWTVFVEFKKGFTRYSAEYDSLEDVIDRLRRGLLIAVNRFKRGETKPFKLEKPYKTVIRVRDNLVADVLEIWSDLKRRDAYTLEYEAENAEKLLGIIELIAFIGYGVDALKASLR